MAEEQLIFDDIYNGDLEAVQLRVLADTALLEERKTTGPLDEDGAVDADCAVLTPLMYAIFWEQPAIALWLLQHRGQHDINTADNHGMTTLHHASMMSGMLGVVQALVAAGADPAALNGCGQTPLIVASDNDRTDVMAYLLQLPAVKATIDHIDRYQGSALSRASWHGNQSIVQLLLDAGADPTIPAGERSPINRALSNNHHAIAALLRHTIAEADRFRLCVTLLGKEKGLCGDLYRKVLGYMLPAWAAKGPAGV